MENALIDFVGKLRNMGLSVSQAELMDAAFCLPHVDLMERVQFKDALRSTLIKRSRDIPLFDTLFDLHFSEGSTLGVAAEEDASRRMQEIRTAIEEQDAMRSGELSPVTMMLMRGNFGELTRLMLTAMDGLSIRRMELAPLRGRFFVNQLRQMMDPDRVRSETEAVLSELDRRRLDPAAIREFRQFVAESLERLDSEVERLVGSEVAITRFTSLRRIEDREIADRSLFLLTEKDISAMRPAVERLARRLKDRLSLRLKKLDRGRLDIKGTFRSNIGYGGPLPDLRFRNKRVDRPQVVALCDVSRSVRDFSRFMLLFLYTLKEVVSRIRSFIFVGDLAEVTSLFQERNLDEAVSRAAAGQGLRYRFGTDYGSSLDQFVHERLGSVNAKTTVMILGDARNNNFPPRTDAMETIAERARRVIWLNPEPIAFWGTGDSVMPLYEPYCAALTECGSLAQLSDAIEENLIP